MRENRTYGLTRGLWGNCPVPYSTVYFSWRSWRETNFFFAVGLRQNKNYVNLQ